ncbi:hypothetical protein CDL15_Pgr028938 [Punica granatum]|uniref:Uncharacterized protein n=1 Tax=Punica granatum TaxID=22663 RepID=A0A218WYL7_PUNGR|nr:hypothetical protein CDL15_Pgr028938 [Punica granatum]
MFFCCSYIASDSWQGKAIARAWNSVSEGFAWLLGCGHRVRFWSDPWVPGCAALSAVSLQDLEAEHSEQLIADCVDGSGHWKWAEFGHFIDHSTALKIAAIKPPRPDDPPDHLYWSRISSGIFSVSSAYCMLVSDMWNDSLILWKLIWRWRGPERIHSFLWLVAHDRLLTES